MRCVGEQVMSDKDSTGDKPGRKITAICYLNNGYLMSMVGIFKFYQNKSMYSIVAARWAEFNNGIIKGRRLAVVWLYSVVICGTR